MEPRIIKPDGVSTLQLLAMIAGVLLLAGDLALVSGAGTSTDGPMAFGILITLFFGYLGLALITRQIILFGEMLLILAFVYFITALGLFQRRRWAWSLSIILSVLAIAVNLVQIAVLSSPVGQALGWPMAFGLPSLLGASAILAYLMRPRVRHLFRR